MATTLPPTITDALVTLTYAGVQPGVSAGQYFGYCTVADVRYEFPDIAEMKDLSTDNATSRSIIAQEITASASEIQEMIDPFYQMPYAGTNGPILLKLRQMNAKLAVANLIEHYFQGSEPNMSPWAAARRAWVELQVTDLKNGVVRWDTPFGDATARALAVVYDPSTALLVGGTAVLGPQQDDQASSPIFTISRNRFRQNNT